MDRFGPETRSRVMSAVGSRDTAPEILLRRLLRRAGLAGRYRLHRQVAGARPDIVFPAARVAVFVDGCFWHRCPACGRRPSSNLAYWLPKLSANAARDRRDSRRLRAAGWRVVRIWEHELARAPGRCLRTVLRALRMSIKICAFFYVFCWASKNMLFYDIGRTGDSEMRAKTEIKSEGGRKLVVDQADFRRYAPERIVEKDGTVVVMALCEELDPESGRWEPFYSFVGGN